jgi:hypothetical protein
MIDFDLFLKQTKQYYQLDLDALHNLVKMVADAMIFHRQMDSYVRVLIHMKVFIVMPELAFVVPIFVAPETSKGRFLHV